MSQPTRELVLAKIRQTFPDENPDDILAILDPYEQEPLERERERVQLAILMLSRGNKEDLLAALKGAKSDFRDVLVVAEYPHYCSYTSRVSKLDQETLRKLKEKDLRQYLSWLHDTEEPDVTGYENYEAWASGRK